MFGRGVVVGGGFQQAPDGGDMPRRGKLIADRW
jgi:hypothetical protein